MNRRDFLRGTVVGVTAAASTALVQIATPEETRLVKEGAPVTVASSPVLMAPRPTWEHTVYMKNSHGEFVAVGLVTRISMEAHVDRAFSWEGEAMLVPQRRTATMLFGGELE